MYWSKHGFSLRLLARQELVHCCCCKRDSIRLHSCCCCCCSLGPCTLHLLIRLFPIMHLQSIALAGCYIMGSLVVRSSFRQSVHSGLALPAKSRSVGMFGCNHCGSRLHIYSCQACYCCSRVAGDFAGRTDFLACKSNLKIQTATK